MEKQIVDITSANPRSFNLRFSTWSLRVLAGFLMHDLNAVDRISHSEIRNILLKHGTKGRKYDTVLSNKRRSNYPEYTLKKSTLNMLCCMILIINDFTIYFG